MQIEVVFRNLTPSDPLKNYALKRFQKSRRLPVTGIADAATIDALEAALSRAEKRARSRASGKPK